jgi:putative membrane protein
MSNSEVAAGKPRSLAKGIVAGLIGGLAGTVAKTLVERMFPPRTRGEQEPQEALAGHELSPEARAMAAEGIHWRFGAAAGAVYGALAEYFPAATAKEGASFGMALEALTHETALPALGLSAEPEDQTTRERASEMTSHVVYGITTELVRRFVRKLL